MNIAITPKQKKVTLLSVVRPPRPTPSAASAAGASGRAPTTTDARAADSRVRDAAEAVHGAEL